MPVISRGVPAFTNDDCNGGSSAAFANDDDYDTQWRSCAASPSAARPVWLSYQLSGVPVARRGRVLVVWYNDPRTSPYDHTLIRDRGYNIPSSYVLEGNAAGPGGVPTSDWVTMVTVSGNHYHSRQHLIDMTGFNWLRMSITASDGSPLNLDVSLNLDVHDAGAGAVDDWIFFGDSITQEA
jgi:hypothetical protein